MNTAAYIRPMVMPPLRMIAALLIMALALACGEFLKPSRYWADELGNPVYGQLLPTQFGAWVQQPGESGAVVNPVQAEMLDKIYSETVSRTYLNRQTGRMLMLSMAYGRDQSTDTQLHTPEMCYPSQGFRVDEVKPDVVHAPWGDMPVMRMQTTMGQRTEPLTYFVRNGDALTTQGSLQRNLARLGLAIRGYKVDGLLVRVSEVTQRPDAFAVQSQFLTELLQAMQQDDRQKIIGKIAGKKT